MFPFQIRLKKRTNDNNSTLALSVPSSGKFGVRFRLAVVENNTFYMPLFKLDRCSTFGINRQFENNETMCLCLDSDNSNTVSHLVDQISGLLDAVDSSLPQLHEPMRDGGRLYVRVSKDSKFYDVNGNPVAQEDIQAGNITPTIKLESVFSNTENNATTIIIRLHEAVYESVENTTIFDH
jgi:hypothetical protein